MKKLIKVKPMFNRIITTMNVVTKDRYKGHIITEMEGEVETYQTVLAVGNTVRDIKVGDIVAINPIRYAIMKHEDKSLKNGVIGDNMTVRYRFNTIVLNDKECLMLYDQDIDFVVEESEEVEDFGIIMPEEPKLLV